MLIERNSNCCYDSCMFTAQKRNRLITVFVLAWLGLFHYESLRAEFLGPIVGRELPKFKFLFPPAGWIMFYHIEETEIRAEVYGKKDGKFEWIDPHRIFNIHWLGYDNIHRNILVSVLDSGRSASSFCRYLRRKFPDYDGFSVMEAIYPSNIKYPEKRILKTAYEC